MVRVRRTTLSQARPHTPAEAQGASPQFLGKEFLQSILLAVLRRSRLPIFSSIFFSPIWGFSLNLFLSIFLAQLTHLLPLFYAEIAQMKIFLSIAF